MSSLACHLQTRRRPHLLKQNLFSGGEASPQAPSQRAPREHLHWVSKASGGYSHFWTWKNWSATPSASPYLESMAPGGPGTGSGLRRLPPPPPGLRFMMANIAAVATSAAISATISHPQHPRVYLDPIPAAAPPIAFAGRPPPQNAPLPGGWSRDLGSRRRRRRVPAARETAGGVLADGAGCSSLGSWVGRVGW